MTKWMQKLTVEERLVQVGELVIKEASLKEGPLTSAWKDEKSFNRNEEGDIQT